MKSKFTVYVLTRSDGLQYVGMTCNLKSRVYQHSKSKRFKAGITDVRLVGENLAHGDACLLEEQTIELLDTYKNGLNMTSTGRMPGTNEQFNSIGMSFTKETIWINDGNTNARIDPSMPIPDGFEKGRLYNRDWKGHSEKSKKAMSEKRKGKPYGVKTDIETIRAVLIDYKNKVEVEGVGEPTGNHRSPFRTYERAFSQYAADKYNMTQENIFRLIRKKGGIAFADQWKEIIDGRQMES